MNDLEPTSSSLAGQATTAVRYMMAAFGGYLVGQGIISGDTAELMTAIAATATPMLIGMAITRMNVKKVIAAKREVVALKAEQNSEA